MCHSTAPFKGQGLAIHGQVHQALMVEARLVRGVHAGHHALCNILPVKNYTHWHIYACAVKVGSCHAAWLASKLIGAAVGWALMHFWKNSVRVRVREQKEGRLRHLPS